MLRALRVPLKPVHHARTPLPRRTFLRGAGVSLALPFLECMLPRAGRCAEDAPRRSVFVYVPNGVNMLDWQIESAGEGYALPVSLRPLEPHRACLTVLSGLHHASGIGRAHECEKVWLTGAAFSPGPGELRNTQSVDQRMAEVIGDRTRFPSLQIALTGGSLAWSREGVALPAETRPRALFERLFGTDPGGAEETRRRLRRRASVLDAVLDGADDLRRRIGSADRGTLDGYLEAVRELERRTVRADEWLDVPRPAVDPSVAARLEREVPEAEAGEYYRTVLDLVLLALRTDSTRVVTCMLGSESRSFALPELGIRRTRHELSHHGHRPETMQELSRADRFLVERLAAFLDGLRDTDEAGGSLLDLTLVLFGSGMSYGQGHGNANLPTLLAGGRALGLRHGQHLDFNLPALGRYELDQPRRYYEACLRPVDPEARLADLLLTMLGRMGVSDASFADSSRTITELLA